MCLVAAAIIVTEAVIVRKLLGISTIWQIEASVFLLIFTVFVGAPFVQKNEHHLNVDLVIIHLSPRTREITLIVVSIHVVYPDRHSGLVRLAHVVGDGR